MSRTTRLHLSAILALTITAGLGFAAAPPPIKPPTPKYRISGPFTHENLTDFFLHGDDQIKGKKILTLDEALEQKKVVVPRRKMSSRSPSRERLQRRGVDPGRQHRQGRTAGSRHCL